MLVTGADHDGAMDDPLRSAIPPPVAFDKLAAWYEAALTCRSLPEGLEELDGPLAAHLLIELDGALLTRLQQLIDVDEAVLLRVVRAAQSTFSPPLPVATCAAMEAIAPRLLAGRPFEAALLATHAPVSLLDALSTLAIGLGMIMADGQEIDRGAFAAEVLAAYRR